MQPTYRNTEHLKCKTKTHTTYIQSKSTQTQWLQNVTGCGAKTPDKGFQMRPRIRATVLHRTPLGQSSQVQPEWQNC